MSGCLMPPRSSSNATSHVFVISICLIDCFACVILRASRAARGPVPLDCADDRLRGEAAVQRNKWAFAAVKPALAPRCALTIGYAIGPMSYFGARAQFSRAVAISHPSTLGPGGVLGLPSCERWLGPLTAPFCLLRKQSRHGISLGARTLRVPFRSLALSSTLLTSTYRVAGTVGVPA